MAPQTWSAVGGPGSINSCEHIDVLVVANDPDALAEVTELLTKLRRHLAQRVQPTPTQAGPLEAEATRLVVYFLPTPEPSIRPTPSSGEKPGGGQQPSGQGGGFFSLPLGQMGSMGFSSQAVIPETEVMEIIRQLVEPKSWSARDDVYIKADSRPIDRPADGTGSRQDRTAAAQTGCRVSSELETTCPTPTPAAACGRRAFVRAGSNSSGIARACASRHWPG